MYAVHQQMINPDLVDGARRRLNLEIRRRGLTAEEVAEWQTTTFFPWLRDAPEILALRRPLERHMNLSGEDDLWCEPQILIRLPDEERDWPAPGSLVYHTDDLPPWAPSGSRYRFIAGVNLTNDTWRSGSVRVQTPLGAHPVALRAGDVIFMNPDLPHCGAPNMTPDVRMAVYFRVIEVPHG